MRVGLDIQSAVARRAGVGRYTHALAAHLPAAAAPGDEVFGFYFDFRRAPPPFPPGAGPPLRINRLLPGRLVQQAWRRLGWPAYERFAGPADVFHFPNFIIPPLRRGARAVATVHDLGFLRFPETLEPKNLAYLTSRIRDTLRRAAAVITDSEFIRAELLDAFPETTGRVTAIPCGLSEHAPAPAPAAAAAWRKKLGLARPYLLAVGTLEPRKNYALLVEAFQRLEKFDGDLVIAGMRGWKDEPILEKIARSPRTDRIRRLDFVPDEALGALYAGAELFVQPSLYEGFGFTPLEAMRHGAPVLSSRAGSLPEALGAAAAYGDHTNPDAWAAAMADLLGDDARRAALRAAGPAWAARYTWAETARRAWDVYREAAHA